MHAVDGKKDRQLFYLTKHSKALLCAFDITHLIFIITLGIRYLFTDEETVTEKLNTLLNINQEA